MGNFKKDLPTIIGIIATAAVAGITGGIAAPIMPSLLSLAGNLSAGIASNKLSEVTLGRMKKWIGKENLEDLNHSIGKLFVNSIITALSLINATYSESKVEGISKHEKKQAKKIVDQLSKELQQQIATPSLIQFDEAEVSAILKISAVKKEVEVSEIISEKDINKDFVDYILLKMKDLDVPSSFKECLFIHLIPQIQLCFGKGLENSENNDARVAFQRMMTENIQSSLNRIESDISSLKTTSGFSKEEMEELRQLKEILQNKELVTVKIKSSIADSLKIIEEKEDELIRITTQTNLTVEEIRKLVIKREKQDRIHHIIVYLLMTLLCVAVATTVYFVVNQPFTATIQVYGWKGHAHNPLDGKGAIVLTLGDKTEKADINKQGEAIFKKILPEYKGKAVRIDLTDIQGEPYYLIDSLITIKKDDKSYIRTALVGIDKIMGEALDELTLEGVPDVTVSMAAIEVKTDNRGRFEINIPDERQEVTQEIEIYKEGYQSYRKTIQMMGENKCRIVLTRK